MRSSSDGQRLRVVISRYLQCSLAEAASVIAADRVTVNGYVQKASYRVASGDLLELDGKEILPPQLYYVAFNKPRGIECTLNKEIESNLLTVFQHKERLYPVGRLDKESEGLLLMTNDGSIYHDIAHSDSQKEKEYYVEVHKPIDEHFIQSMREGMIILGQHTGPSKVNASESNPNAFSIVLTRGMNRQIRRMCYKLGYSVHKLVRLRIMHVNLDTLQPGEMRDLTPAEVEVFRNK
jgi:23S rRNA pseudouridine2604 synthase